MIYKVGRGRVPQVPRGGCVCDVTGETIENDVHSSHHGQHERVADDAEQQDGRRHVDPRHVVQTGPAAAAAGAVIWRQHARLRRRHAVFSHR